MTATILADFGRVVAEVFCQRDLKIAMAMSEWVRRQHRPLTPNAEKCWNCRKSWPCEQYESASARAADLRARINP